MKLISDPEAQPKHEVKSSNQRSNVSAYTTWRPQPEKQETKEQVMHNIAKGLHSSEFQQFVKLVGKDAATNYLKRILETKKD